MSIIGDLAAGLKTNLDTLDINVSKFPRSNPIGNLIHLWPSDIPSYHRAMQVGLVEVVFTVQLGRSIGAAPWWITLATAGAVLLVIAVTSERRVSNASATTARLRDLN